MQTRIFRILQFLTFAVVAAWLFLVFARPAAVVKTPSAESLSVYGPVPAFSMTERSGRVWTDKMLSDRPWIADFIFTRCQGQCPMMSAQMKRLQGELPDFRLVSFTVDPAFDTPAVLSAYAESFGATSRWLFFNGGQDQTNAVLKEFKLSGAGDPATHSVDFVLIDSQNRVRGYYDATDAAALARLVQDARRLSSKLF